MRARKGTSLPYNDDKNNVARIFISMVPRFLISPITELPVDTLPADFRVVMIPGAK